MRAEKTLLRDDTRPDRTGMLLAAMLSLILVLAMTVSLALPVTMAQAPPGESDALHGQNPDEPEEEEEEWSAKNITNALEDDDVLQGLFIAGIACFIISLPISISKKKTRRVEDDIPDVLTEVSANIRSANSVESSLRDVATVRTDYTGRLLQATCQRMNETSFSQAMEEFGLKAKSVTVQRIVSLINIAIESGASIADVLDKISSELFSIYSLRQERENKSATNASVILWGGVTFTPGIIGFILGFFNAGAGVPLGSAPDIIKSFLIFFAIECAFMHAVAMGSMKVDMIRVPFYMFMAQFIFVLSYNGSPAVMG